MANLPGDSDTSHEGDRLQAEYLERLRRLLRRAPPEIREDALREVQSHIEDEWQAMGGDLPALRTVLERLGPPEVYGRDLALQLILLQRGDHRMPARLALAAIFWASTSLMGAVVMILSTLIFSLALGMLFVAIGRALGSSLVLLDFRDFQFFHYHVARWSFPPITWSPILIGLAGVIPAVAIFAGLYRFLSIWVRSRLGQSALSRVITEQPSRLPLRWERHAVLAMLAFAILGLTSCLLFTMLGERIVVGNPSSMALPDDFFSNPVMVLAGLAGLVFLLSPVLGLLWAAKNNNSNGHSAR